MDVQPNFCPFCGSALPPDSYFCPHCGKEIKIKELSTSVVKQILIYLVSFFLPPLGLMWSFKYLKQGTRKARNIGWTSIILTAAGIVVAIWATMGILNGLNASLSGALGGSGSQLNQLMQMY